MPTGYHLEADNKLSRGLLYSLGKAYNRYLLEKVTFKRREAEARERRLREDPAADELQLRGEESAGWPSVYTRNFQGEGEKIRGEGETIRIILYQQTVSNVRRVRRRTAGGRRRVQVQRAGRPVGVGRRGRRPQGRRGCSRAPSGAEHHAVRSVLQRRERSLLRSGSNGAAIS